LITEEEVLDIFKEKMALIEGHFELSSGLHSARYLQAALVLQYPLCADKLCRALAQFFKDKDVQLVISPAIGGIVVGQKVAEVLGARAIFAERKGGEKLILRRGFKINRGERVVVVEDVITTGGSIKEIIKIVEDNQGKLVGAGCLINRSGRKMTFVAEDTTLNGSIKKKIIPLKSLLNLKLETYPEGECPLCKRGLPIMKPGSKGL
jgi:orotate phosphoribosyltransferase